MRCVIYSVSAVKRISNAIFPDSFASKSSEKYINPVRVANRQ